MNEKMQPTEYTRDQSNSTYQTGSTNPPKSHVGFLSVLLSLVIVFCGVSTILSMMRINLLQKILHQTQSQKCTMAFAEAEAAPAQLEHTSLGFHGKPLDAFWQSYHQLPKGIYVTDPGEAKPLKTGDVIVSADGTPIADWDALDQIAGQYEPGQQLTVSVYRNSDYVLLNLTIYE